MSVRKWVVPFVLAIAAVGMPSVAHAAPIAVTVTVTGAQNYGGTAAFAGSTGVTGLTVSGVTCTGLSNGSAIDPSLNALGSYTIAGATCSGGTLSKPGYTIAGYTGSTFSVYRAKLTVKADDASRVYGAANPTFGYTISGFVNGQDSSVVTGSPALSTTATTTSNVGTYPISVSAGTLAVPSNNYFFGYTGGTLTVSPKPVNVTVTGAQNYGDAASFTARTGVTGLTATGATCTGVTGGQSISPSLPAGAYTTDPATCSGAVLSSSNYTISSYKSGSYLVFKVALTVTASDATRVFGAANPTFDYTVTGFQNGDDASVVSGAPELTTTATTSSDVGSYPISAGVGTLSAANYRFVFVDGTLTVDPKPVSIAVTGAQNYGDAATFSGRTGVSGLTVSGVTCTGVTGGQTISPSLPAGSYTTDPATCGGGVLSSSNYTIASYKSSTFLVFKSALTVTAGDATRLYGSGNPAFTYTITGFKNGDDAASSVTGSPTLTSPATGSSDVGSYPINASVGTLASDNYKFIYVPGTLTVNPRPVTVTMSGAQNYGDAAVFYPRTGVTGLTVTDATCTGLTGGQAVAPTLTVGGYTTDPSTCGGGVLSSTNYTIGSYKSANFLVYKVNLTVTANDKSKTYGNPNPALDYTITGFKNDDDASDISGTPTLSTEVDNQSNAGTYPIDIVAGTLAATNYRFVLVDGTFTVNKRQLTVAADPATRAYGDAPPAYTATFTGFRNGDTAADLTGAPEFSTPATVASDPGTYPLNVAQGTLSSPNYTFGGFTPSTLTITSGVATITTAKMLNATITAVITYGVNNTPVVGSTITFTVGNGSTVACTAVTDATGKAACVVSGIIKTNIQLGGYTAHFPGTANLLPGEKHQGIL